MTSHALRPSCPRPEPPPLRVVILFNEPILPLDHPDADSEHEIHYTVDLCASGTRRGYGYDVQKLGVCRDPGVLLAGMRAGFATRRVMFNLFEGSSPTSVTPNRLPRAFSRILGVPYTGSPYQTLCMARSKHVAKHLLQGAGLPTAPFFVVEVLPLPPCPIEWPVIVKPATQDASVGVDQGSVVTDQLRLSERVAYLLETYGPPVLVEQFVRGRELNVGLIEAPDLRVLPISEILFTDADPDFWPIVTYDAKWKPGTRDYESTPPLYPAEVTPRLKEKLETLAKQVFRLLDCRDYARVAFPACGPAIGRSSWK